MELQELTTLHLQTKAWEKDNCFQSLCEHLVKNNIVDVYDWLSSRVSRHLAGNTQYEYEWKAILRLTACACISTVEGKNAERICRNILEPLSQLNVLGKGEEITNDQLPTLETDLVYLALQQYIWPAPFNPAWAWDAVRQFRGTANTSIRESITILLHDGEGVPAKLLLDAFPGIRPGLVSFPDPRYMTFVQMGEDFRLAFQTGAEFAWSLAEAQGCPPVEMRWRIMRMDDEPLNLLKGQSVGAAFALALAKLLTHFISLPKL